VRAFAGNCYSAARAFNKLEHIIQRALAACLPGWLAVCSFSNERFTRKPSTSISDGVAKVESCKLEATHLDTPPNQLTAYLFCQWRKSSFSCVQCDAIISKQSERTHLINN
jgi:hypothetical protein